MALTTAQQAILLFKKWLGLGQASASREFFNESYVGRPIVYSSQIWAEENLIPPTASAFTGSGHTIGVVQYWQNVALTQVAGVSASFYSPLLIDAIPFYYGPSGSYNYAIKKRDGNSVAFGSGDWVLDNEAGLLTFYSTLPYAVSDLPLSASFYRYVGRKGIVSSSYAETASVATSISFTPVTASYSLTASVALNAGPATSASWASSSISSSYSTTSSAATSITFVPVTASFSITSSYAVAATSASAATSITFVPATASHAQAVDYVDINGKPTLVSASAQINTGSFTGSFIGTLTGTASYASVAPYSGLTGVPSGIISSSTQLPSGLVSSSVQINTGSFTGSFIGTLQGSASFATTSSAATSITFVPPTASYAYTASYALNASAQQSVSASWASSSISSSYAASALSASYAPGGGLSGGQTNYVPLWTSPTSLGVSIITQSGAQINIGGAVTASAYVGTGSGLLIDAGDFITGSGTIRSPDSYVISASHAFVSVTASYALASSGIIDTATSASYAKSASLAERAVSASWAPGAMGVSASYATTSSYAVSASWAPGGMGVSASYATTASYAVNASTSLNKKVRFGVPLVTAIDALFALQDMTSGEAEVTDNIRTRVDLTSVASASISARVAVIGATNSRLIVQYSADEVIWNYLASPSIAPFVSLGTIGTQLGTEVAITGSAKQPVTLRLIASGGNGIDDPQIGNVTLFLAYEL